MSAAQSPSHVYSPISCGAPFAMCASLIPVGWIRQKIRFHADLNSVAFFHALGGFQADIRCGPRGLARPCVDDSALPKSESYQEEYSAQLPVSLNRCDDSPVVGRTQTAPPFPARASCFHRGRSRRPRSWRTPRQPGGNFKTISARIAVCPKDLAHGVALVGEPWSRSRGPRRYIRQLAGIKGSEAG